MRMVANTIRKIWNRVLTSCRGFRNASFFALNVRIQSNAIQARTRVSYRHPSIAEWRNSSSSTRPNQSRWNPPLSLWTLSLSCSCSRRLTIRWSNFDVSGKSSYRPSSTNSSWWKIDLEKSPNYVTLPVKGWGASCNWSVKHRWNLNKWNKTNRSCSICTTPGRKT